MIDPFSAATMNRFRFSPTLAVTLGCALMPGIAWGQSPASDSDQALVPRIIAQMRDNLNRLPDYTCTETIRRTRVVVPNPENPDKKVHTEDTLRIEVALLNGQELFALPGASQFDDAELKSAIIGGTFGSGAFGLYTRILFLREDRPPLRPKGRVDLKDLDHGKGLIKYDFTVPQNWNQFSFTVGSVSSSVGFEGSIYVDPKTLDLRRIDLDLTDMPAQLGLKIASDQVNYDRVAFEKDKFLLPISNVLTLAGPEVDTRNQVRFQKCRKFEGESTISFLDPEQLQQEEEAQQVHEVMLPARTELEIEMESKLQVTAPEATAVGDIVTGKMVRGLQINGEEVIPKGAIATGRIVQADRYPNFFTLQIHFTDINWESGHAKVRTYLHDIPYPDRLSLPAKDPLTMEPARDFSGALNGNKVIMIAKPAPARLKGLLTQWMTF